MSNLITIAGCDSCTRGKVKVTRDLTLPSPSIIIEVDGDDAGIVVTIKDKESGRPVIEVTADWDWGGGDVSVVAEETSS